MHPRHASRLFALLQIGSGLAALYHVAGVMQLLSADSAPPMRHAVFICISAAGILYFRRRPIQLLPLFLLLVGQQVMSHGGRALDWWTTSGRVDWISLVTLSGLAVATVALVIDARDRSPIVRRVVCPFSAPVA